MGSRERKRAERRKRKRRSAERSVEGADPLGNGDAAAEPTGVEGTEPFRERYARRAEERNAEARARLEPLAQGERPTVVTIGAAISAVIALIWIASAVVALVGSVEIEGDEPNPVPLAAFGLVFSMMAWGMWRARYWAVLGFQMILVLMILATATALVGATELSVLQVVGSALLLAGLGTLFYFMIRAMARIQMPERPGGG
jgi:hypothetical protein